MSEALLRPEAPPPSAGAFISGLARWTTAASLAVLITFALFMVMQILIRVDVISLPEPRPVEEISISEYVPDDRPDRRSPPEPEVVSPPPPIPTLDTQSSDLPSEAGPSFQTAPPTTQPDITASLDGMIIAPSPISVRVPPAYPARERERGISGTCTIRYDILASGRTVNAQAIQCDSAGFARASLAAVERWRHRSIPNEDPNRLVNRGVETTLVFELED
ncbi:TonB family protein [Oceanicaulis alexandrii]|uniref:energy transducer TonB n=1 Tax=Oceanicaulis alexandrii TaxID=153233 RepID=UPI0035CF2201